MAKSRAERSAERSAKKPRRGIWRTEVSVRIGELDNRKRVAACAPPASPLTTCEHERLVEAVDRCLARAREAVERDRGKLQHLSSWWSGASMTTGWESIHEAELHLLSIESRQAAQTTLPWLLSWVRRVMGRGTGKTQHEEKLRKQIDKSTLDRTQARQALRDVIVANNAHYGNLRAFRNNLVVVTGLLAGLIVAICAWHAINPSILSLCTTVDATATAEAKTSCLTGEESRPADIALIALVGAFGGMLAIAFGLAKTKSPPSRYDPKAWLGLLKPVAGAATAIVAVVLIQAEILLGPNGEHSELMLLSYAAIFGFSQQLLTQFVDKRAEALIEPDAPATPDG